MASDQESAAPDSGGSSVDIEELVAQCLLRVEADGQDGLSEFLAEHQALAAEIKERLAWLADLGLVILPGSEIDLSPDRSGVYRMLRESRSAPDPEPDGDGFGHYRIVKELGRGGQAVVYRADDTRLNRQVALKVMTGFGEFDDKALARFRREAEVASRLDHPGICTVYESGAFDKTAYIAMRLVDGETLGERIKRARDDDRDEPASLFLDLDDEKDDAPTDAETHTVPDRIDVMRTIEVVERTARALHTAHEAGVIHRDIKPGNIMVTREGSPVVLDFGLAGDTESDLQTLTREGDFFGTPAYMSPEQLAANRITVDRRTDVYSLGVLLFECLTLERPFQVPTREALYQAILTVEPPSPRSINPAISPDLEVVIATAMDKNRDRRYQTAEDLAEELRRVREHEPIQARPASTVTRLLRWAQRHPARATATAATVLILLISAALVTWSLGESQRAALSDEKTVAEQKARELETLRAEEAEAEREQLRAQERERVFRDALTDLVSQGGSEALTDPEAAHRRGVGPGFAVFEAFGLALMDERGVDAIVGELGRVSADRPRFRNEITHGLYDLSLRLLRGGTAQAVAHRDGEPLPGVSPHRLGELKAILEEDPEAVSRWERLVAVIDAWDQDPWRRDVWTELVSANKEGRNLELGDLTSDARLEKQSASSLVWLAGGLLHSGGLVGLFDHLERSERIIDTALAKHSDDPATLFMAWMTKSNVRLMVALAGEQAGSLSSDGVRAAREDALRAAEAARDLHPKACKAYQSLAQINGSLGRHGAAKRAFERALELDPDAATISRAAYGDGLLRGGDHKGALAIFRDLVDENPDVGNYHRILGAVLLTTGATKEAISVYRKAFDLDPTQMQVCATLGYVLLRMGDPEGAYDILSRGMDVHPRERQLRNMMAGALAGLKDPERTEAVFEKLRAADPDSAEPYLLKGSIRQGWRDWSGALATYQQGLARDPRSLESYLAVAKAMSHLDDHAGAIGITRKGLAIWPDDVGLHTTLSVALWKAGELEEAVSVGREAIRLGDTGYDSNLAVGGSLAMTGAFEEAIPFLRKALELANQTNKNRAWPGGQLMGALIATGDLDGAYAEAKRAVEAYPSGVNGHILLSSLEAARGDYGASLARLVTVRDLSGEGWMTRTLAEDILAIQPVVRGVAQPETALDFLRASRAASHRWEARRCADLFDEAYKRAKADTSMKNRAIRLAEGALEAASAVAMMGRGLGREYVPPLAIRDAQGAPVRTADGQIRFIDSRPARPLRDLLDADEKEAANERAFTLLRICLDEVLAGLSATDDKGEIKRLRRVLQSIAIEIPFFAIFRHPPKDAPWAARARVFMARVTEQWQRER